VQITLYGYCGAVSNAGEGVCLRIVGERQGQEAGTEESVRIAEDALLSADSFATELSTGPGASLTGYSIMQ